MRNSIWKSLAYTTALGSALLLLAGASGAQPGPYGYQQWYHNTWQSGPYPYYGQLPAGPGHLGPMPVWGGSVIGASSSLQDMGDYYLLQMRLPGINANDLKMDINGRVLTIAIHATASQNQTPGQWHSFFQDMQQTFTLPQPVDSARMQGNFQNGILTMMVPKAGRKLPGQ